jgi:hypothetical protein
MDRRSDRFLRTHPRLVKTIILLSLLSVAVVVAFFGLQIHSPSQSRLEFFLEWAIFLAALAACLAILLGGARLQRAAKPADPDRGPEGS